MAMKSGQILIIGGLLGGILASQGCYYDVESDLYPKNYCDTTNIRYAATIEPIVSASCAVPGCHVPGVQGVDDFTTYGGFHAQVTNGAVVSAIEWTGATAVMPPSGKLRDCDIKKILIWVNAGSPDN